jgi:hypothetical protein
VKFTPEFTEEFQEIFMTSEDTREEIQNSSSVRSDEVYIVTNYALYNLWFNEENKEIELDPKWVHAYTQRELIHSGRLNVF